MLAPGDESGSVRPSSAAGLYYPKEAEGLRCALQTLLGSGGETAQSTAEGAGRAARGLCLFRRRRRLRVPHCSRERRRPRSATWCCSAPATASRCTAWQCPRATSSRRRSARCPSMTQAAGTCGNSDWRALRTRHMRSSMRSRCRCPSCSRCCRTSTCCRSRWDSPRPSRWVVHSTRSGAARRHSS